MQYKTWRELSNIFSKENTQIDNRQNQSCLIFCECVSKEDVKGFVLEIWKTIRREKRVIAGMHRSNNISAYIIIQMYAMIIDFLHYV